MADGKQYRKLVGKLQYLTITRPDISFAVGKLAQYSSTPSDCHLQALHKVLRYLKGSCEVETNAIQFVKGFKEKSEISKRESQEQRKKHEDCC